MFTVVLIMAAGILAGFAARNYKFLLKAIDPIIAWAIYILLFLLGISIGVNDKIINNLDSVGLTALTLTLGAISGSVFIAYLTFILFFNDNEK
jgi:uncharacterized membrane protein YbjE (DUF340 family)